MKQIITKFNDETGDFDVVTPVPFTLNDGIEVLGMMVADIPKYEDTKTYNVFDLIRENQELKKQLEDEQNYTQSLWSDFQDYKEEVSEYLGNTECRFIKYLEESINTLENEQTRRFNHTYQYKIDVLKDCLFKYKEIVGDKNE